MIWGFSRSLSSIAEMSSSSSATKPVRAKCSKYVSSDRVFSVSRYLQSTWASASLDTIFPEPLRACHFVAPVPFQDHHQDKSSHELTCPCQANSKGLHPYIHVHFHQQVIPESPIGSVCSRYTTINAGVLFQICLTTSFRVLLQLASTAKPLQRTTKSRKQCP